MKTEKEVKVTYKAGQDTTIVKVNGKITLIAYDKDQKPLQIDGGVYGDRFRSALCVAADIERGLIDDDGHVVPSEAPKDFYRNQIEDLKCDVCNKLKDALDPADVRIIEKLFDDVLQ